MAIRPVVASNRGPSPVKSAHMLRRDLLRTMAAAPFAMAASAQTRYEANWASIDRRPSPAVVHGREVRHLHPLGRLLGAGLRRRQREGRDRLRRVVLELADQEHDRPNGPTWKFHQRVYGANFPYFDFAPDVPRRALRSRPLGRRLRARRREVCRAHLEASRGLHALEERRGQSHVGPPVECRRYRTEARRPSRPDDCRPQARAGDGHLLFALRVVQPAVALG